MPFRTEGFGHEAELFPRDRLALYRPGREAQRRKSQISEGVVLDYDSLGNLVGIDIDNASSKVDLKRLVLSKLPGKVETAGA
jgi:uncharacterized protein YuzE